MRTKPNLIHVLPAVIVMLLIGCSDNSGGSGGGADDGGLTVIDPLPKGRGLLPDLALADADFESVHYSGNAICSSCHNNANDGEGAGMVVFEDAGVRDISIGKAWETSMMANATRDPYWHAVVETELDNYPNLDEEINDVCTRCHAPMANDFARKEGLELRLFDAGSNADGNFRQGIYTMDATSELFNHAQDGVSCTLCHQIADDGNLGTPEGMTGGWSVIAYPEANSADRPAYGQYQDPDVTYMRQQSGYTPQYAAHTSTSETCASCHNLTSHTVNPDGEELPGPNLFPEQAVYSEWQQSDYAIGGSAEASCQSCHMPTLEDAVPLTRDGEVMRSGFAEHSFLGANTVMQQMLANFSEELGVPTSVDFGPAIERNREFIASAATIELQNTRIDAGALAFDVAVNNNTGHKLPSGYHSRRVYLHVLVTDARGEVVFESGRMDSQGRIAGNREDLDPSQFEPHHDLITEPTQVQIYQAIMGDVDGERTHSLLNGFNYLKDNRLTPAGFDKGVVPEEVEVAGAAASDEDFDDGSDTVSYRIDVTDAGPYNVRAELRYQPLSYGHLTELFMRSDALDAVDRFRTMYERTTLRDELIASHTVEIP